MISLQSGAAPSFDDPLEMLRACHGKILIQCNTLEKLAAHLKENGCDEQARQAARNMLRYFDTSGRFHHQDEEEDLFPALRAHPSTHALLNHLLDEHVALLASWDELRAVLLQLAEGRNAPLADELVQRFSASYTKHIEIENSELLPHAARLLDAARLRLIGIAMAARRGARPPSSELQ